MGPKRGGNLRLREKIESIFEDVRTITSDIRHISDRVSRIEPTVEMLGINERGRGQWQQIQDTNNGRRDAELYELKQLTTEQKAEMKAAQSKLDNIIAKQAVRAAAPEGSNGSKYIAFLESLAGLQKWVPAVIWIAKATGALSVLTLIFELLKRWLSPQ